MALIRNGALASLAGVMAVITGCGAGSTHAPSANAQPCRQQQAIYDGYEAQMKHLTGRMITNFRGWFPSSTVPPHYSANEKQVLFAWIHLVDNNVGCFSSSDFRTAEAVSKSPVFATIYPSPLAESPSATTR